MIHLKNEKEYLTKTMEVDSEIFTNHLIALMNPDREKAYFRITISKTGVYHKIYHSQKEKEYSSPNLLK
jgi:hypothetical protein